MKCPHCLVEFHDERELHFLSQDVEGEWGIESYRCPNPDCGKMIFYLIRAQFHRNQHGYYEIYMDSSSQYEIIDSRKLIRPIGISRPPIPSEVPQKYKSDYEEACLILENSPKASSALSRRCLQMILRDKAGIKEGNLSSEIQQTIDSKQLPNHLTESIDSIRNIGNFAAHPAKSKSTGEIVNVEPGEAEWNLEVIEMLFDFYFVQPEKTRLKKAKLNQKLKDIGKPKMK